MINPATVRTVDELNTFLKDLKEEQYMELFVTDITFEMPQVIDRGILPEGSYGFLQKMTVEGSMDISLKYKREL